MSSERVAGTVHVMFGRVAAALGSICPFSHAPASWEVGYCELECRTPSRRLQDWMPTAGPEPGISDNTLIELATVRPRGKGRSRDCLVPYTASEPWLALDISSSERMGCSNFGLARSRKLLAASQSASSMSYVPGGCACSSGSQPSDLEATPSSLRGVLSGTSCVCMQELFADSRLT